jgi:hypothetical protein
MRHLVLDLDNAPDGEAEDCRSILKACMQGRRAPIVPSALKEELAKKARKEDQPTVAKLYAEGFAARFGAVENLEYSYLGWGDREAKAARGGRGAQAAGARPQ